VSQSLLETVAADVARVLPHRGHSRCCIALSGGLDSIVLLDLLGTLRRRGYRSLELRALHVDHALQPQSRHWAAAATAAASEVGIVCDVITVRVEAASGSGLEAAARAARHAAFREQLRDGEVLATAHHADDQLETVLLALMRGAGVAGLAAMPRLAPLARGWHWRPLLEVDRTAIEVWARERQLQWSDDPTNAQLRYDRNFLRHTVLPRLRERWPHAAQSAGRSARHLAEAMDLLDGIALADLRDAAVGACLDLAVLRQLALPRRRQLLRFWLRVQGLRVPSERRLTAILADLLGAAVDRNPVIAWEEGASVRRHRGLLYAVHDLADPPPAGACLRLSLERPLMLPCGLGRLRLCGRADAASQMAERDRQLEVRFRQGAERVRLAGHTGSVELGEVLRRARVLPWMRDRVPLVFAGDELVAIGDASLGGRAARATLLWEDAPRWRAER